MDEVDSSFEPSPNPPTLRPQPRITPASGSTRPGAAVRNSFKKFADILKLTKENQDMVQQMYNNTLPNEEYLATLSCLVSLRQDGLLGGSVSKWVPGKVIRETFKDAVRDFILRPNLQAFSKTVASDHTTLVESLEILTFNFCQNLDPEIVDEHGPGDYNAGDACIPGTTMHIFIKETLKNQRSKVRSVLLEHILGVPEGFLTPVQQAKPMVLQCSVSFSGCPNFAPKPPKTRCRGGVRQVRAPGGQMDNLHGERSTPSPNVQQYGTERVSSHQRYVTVYNHLNPTQNKKRCQWTVMDEVLAELRTRRTSERTLYFNEVVRYDRETFTGKRTWDTIRSSGQLPAPTVAQVLERAQASEAGASGSGGGDITGGMGSGNEDDGEETEEQT
ncbi:hypothetical protein DFH28DRAFT_940399 [Melampsora americana]|nr:hypothetical protein DFH28DRAFT_940399 [Melampsora americana]